MPRSDKIAAEWVRTAELQPWPGNPRKNDAAVDHVARSIERFGFGAPIVARAADKMIIAGHTRYKAARKLGLERVPVRFVDLDPADAKLLAIADNKLGELAEWEQKQLAQILKQYSLDDASYVGFGTEELEALKESMAEEGLLDPKKDRSKGDTIPLVKFGRYRLPLTNEDAERWKKIAERYIAEFGTLFGLAEKMISNFELPA